LSIWCNLSSDAKVIHCTPTSKTLWQEVTFHVYVQAEKWLCVGRSGLAEKWVLRIIYHCLNVVFVWYRTANSNSYFILTKSVSNKMSWSIHYGNVTKLPRLPFLI
jgi:hypothetical protein